MYVEENAINLEFFIPYIFIFTAEWYTLRRDSSIHRSSSSQTDLRISKVTPQSAAKTTRIILDRYMYGPVSQFLLRV